MISWIQRTFQHHFRIVFFLVLLVMGVPLVLIYRTGSGGSGDREVKARDFFGYNLSSAEDQRRIMGDGRISVELQLGSLPSDEEQLQNYCLQRAAALHLADEWKLPAASEAQIRSFTQNLRAFAGENGDFDPARYAAFRQNLRLNPGLTEGDIARVIADDARVEAAERLLGGPGYVLPGDIKRQLALTDTRWTAAIAAVDYAGFDPGLKPAEADLQRFFQANSFRYELPPRVEVAAIEFPAARFASEAGVTEAELRAAFDADPARFAPKPAAAAKPGVLLPKPDFAAAHAQVEATVRLEKGTKLAAKAASDFVYALYEGKVASGAAFEAFAAARGLKARPLPAFSRDNPPAELGASPDAAEAAFQLTAQKYYTDALAVPAGAAVLVLKGTLPARQPLYGDARAKVLADYVDGEKRQRFVELGRTLRAAIAARMKAGEAFAQSAQEAAAASRVKVTVKTPAPFTLRTRPADLDPAALGALEHLEKGQVSDMAASADQGYLVCALDKTAPDLSETGAAYLQARAQLAAGISRFDSGAALNELVAQELKRTEPPAK